MYKFLSVIEWTPEQLNIGMKASVEEGHMELVLFFIEKGADDWDGALEMAISAEQNKMVDLFIKKGASDWSRALKACETLNPLEKREHSKQFFKKFL